jgi:hypothetical protein
LPLSFVSSAFLRHFRPTRPLRHFRRRAIIIDVISLFDYAISFSDAFFAAASFRRLIPFSLIFIDYPFSMPFTYFRLSRFSLMLFVFSRVFALSSVISVIAITPLRRAAFLSLQRHSPHAADISHCRHFAFFMLFRFFLHFAFRYFRCCRHSHYFDCRYFRSSDAAAYAILFFAFLSSFSPLSIFFADFLFLAAFRRHFADDIFDAFLHFRFDTLSFFDAVFDFIFADFHYFEIFRRRFLRRCQPDIDATPPRLRHCAIYGFIDAFSFFISISLSFRRLFSFLRFAIHFFAFIFILFSFSFITPFRFTLSFFAADDY